MAHNRDQRLLALERAFSRWSSHRRWRSVEVAIAPRRPAARPIRLQRLSAREHHKDKPGIQSARGRFSRRCTSSGIPLGKVVGLIGWACSQFALGPSRLSPRVAIRSEPFRPARSSPSRRAAGRVAGVGPRVSRPHRGRASRRSCSPWARRSRRHRHASYTGRDRRRRAIGTGSRSGSAARSAGSDASASCFAWG